MLHLNHDKYYKLNPFREEKVNKAKAIPIRHITIRQNVCELIVIIKSYKSYEI